VTEFFKGLVLPLVSLSQILSATYPENPKTNMVLVASYAACFLGWTGLFFASRPDQRFSGVTFTLFCVTGTMLRPVRSGFRTRYNIRSNHLADFVAGVFFWPQVLSQMRLHCNGLELQTRDNESTIVNPPLQGL
jgi:hypothetical protein